MDRERRVIVDGATGFVGSNFAAYANQQGADVVALARGKAARASDAVAKSLVAQEAPRGVTDDGTKVRGVSFDLDQPDLGVDADELEQLFDAPCDYWHFAANTNLAPIAMGALEATNVGGTRAALDVFRRYANEGSRFFHVSTAYSCGVVDHPVAEEWHPPGLISTFRTYYEATKRAAEQLVHEAIDDDAQPVDAVVVRLGQIVGSSATGRSTSDYGLYDFVSVLHRLVRRHPDDNLRVAGAADATLHLVPIDHCVRWLLTIAGEHVQVVDPPIFHLVDTEDVLVADVADAVNRHLPVNLQIVPEDEFLRRPRTLTERLLAARMTYLGEYVGQRIEFLRDNLAALVPRAVPAVDAMVLERLVGRYVADLDTDFASVPAAAAVPSVSTSGSPHACELAT